MLFRKRVRWFVSVPVIAASALFVGAARWPDEIPLCKTAAAWVGEHRTELPASLVQLSMYTRTYRIAIFNASPIGVQKQFWHDQLEAFITPAASRTSIQRAIVARSTAPALTEHQEMLVRNEMARLDLYFDPSSSLIERRRAVQVTAPRNEGAFDPALRRALFSTLGPLERSFVQPSSATELSEAGLGLALAATRAKTADCNCEPTGINGQGDPCCPPAGQNGICNTVGTGCGLYGVDPCTSLFAQCKAGKSTRRRVLIPKSI